MKYNIKTKCSIKNPVFYCGNCKEILSRKDIGNGQCPVCFSNLNKKRNRGV